MFVIDPIWPLKDTREGGNLRLRGSRDPEAYEEPQEQEPAVPGNKGAQEAKIQYAAGGNGQPLF